MPTMNGGGDTGDVCDAVASAEMSQNDWLLCAMAASSTACPVACRTTRPSSNANSSAGQSSTIAAMAHRFPFSLSHAFCTAIPVM